MARLRDFQKIPLLLALFFLLSPPIAFSANLPTVCMVLIKNQLEPSGPCGHKALFLKADPMEAGLGMAPQPISENAHAAVESLYPARLSPSVVLSKSLPLRC